MSNQLSVTVYERMEPLAAIQALGVAIARSGIFSCPSNEAGQVFALECLARRIPPLMLAERYHVIFGKLSMKAEAMLAGFEAEGGTYKVLARTPEIASIEMTINGQSHKLDLTWEEAKKEPFVYHGKEGEVVAKLLKGETAKLQLKEKYATPRSRMQMLWARLVSDSVRFLCPKVVSGVYTPEELGDVNGDDEPAASNGNTVVQGVASWVASPADSAKDAAVDVPFELKKEGAGKTEAATHVASEGKKPAESQVGRDGPATATPPAGVNASTDGKATVDQVNRIRELEVDLQCGEAVNAFVAKRGLGSIRELAAEDARRLLDRLEIEASKQQLAKSQQSKTATQEKPASAVTVAPATQSTPEQVAALRAILKQVEQIKPGITNEVGQGLYAAGKTKLADLSAVDSARLYKQLQSFKELGDFFQHSLEAWSPPAKQQAKASQPANAA